MTQIQRAAAPLTLTEIAALIAAEEELAADVLHLTANEAVLSPLAERALASPLGNRYLLEHLDMRRDSPSRLGNFLYRGLDMINEIERSATLVCQLMFGAQFAEFRCISGLHAMQTTFAALTRPGDTVMRVSTQDGGHFLTELICRSFGRNSCTYAFSGLGELDVDRTRGIFERERPALLYIDAMNYLFPFPIKELREVVGDTPIIFDASHTLGLIAGHQFPNPLDEGADILQANTHKTFFGPQKGIILGTNRALMERIGYMLSNGTVSSQHTGSTLALFVALHEMYCDGEQYAVDILANARRLGQALSDAGLPMLGADRGFTANHMLFLDTRPFGSGLIALDKLLRANISVNRTIPFAHIDAIRLGVQEITRRGYAGEDLIQIADWLRRLLVERASPESVQPEVVEMVRSRATIRYTGGASENLLGPLHPEPARRPPARPGAPATAGPPPRATPRWIEVRLQPPAEPMPAADFRRVRQLGELAGAFEHQIDSAGNIGAVDTLGRLFVTGTGAYIRNLRDDDMVEIMGCADWTLACRGTGPPSTEAYLHYLLRDRVGARYIVHNHYIPDQRLEELGIATIAPKEYGSVELAEAAADTALRHQAFYVRRHGLVFWAETFAECHNMLVGFAQGMTLI